MYIWLIGCGVRVAGTYFNLHTYKSQAAWPFFLSAVAWCFHVFHFHDSLDTGWRRPIGCLKLQVIFRKKAANYGALWRKRTYDDKASNDSTPPCTVFESAAHVSIHNHSSLSLSHTHKHTHTHTHTHAHTRAHTHTHISIHNHTNLTLLRRFFGVQWQRVSCFPWTEKRASYVVKVAVLGAHSGIGWLRLVGSLKLQVSFAESVSFIGLFCKRDQ